MTFSFPPLPPLSSFSLPFGILWIFGAIRKMGLREQFVKSIPSNCAFDMQAGSHLREDKINS